MWIPTSKTLAGWAVIGVGAVAAAVNFSGSEERDIPAPAASPSAQGTPPVVAPPKMASDPFAGHAPAPATQVQAAPVPPKPVAPPFPFKYAGWSREGRSPAKVYLSRGDAVFPVKPGDVLEGFRIDAVQDERIEVTYLASGEQSSLALASLQQQAAAAPSSSSGGWAASAPGAPLGAMFGTLPTPPGAPPSNR